MIDWGFLSWIERYHHRQLFMFYLSERFCRHVGDPHDLLIFIPVKLYVYTESWGSWLEQLAGAAGWIEWVDAYG